MNKVARKLMLVTAVTLLALASASNVTASLNVVVIPPTDVSSDPDQQLLNSMATLNAFHDAINGAPVEGLIIQLQSGLYDFSALVILDPEGDPPENYSESLDGSVQFFNPLGMQNLPPFEGVGISILGKQHLTIKGASSDSTPTSIIRGCTDSRCQDMDDPAIFFNIGFSIGGDYGEPSRFVTLENLSFESFTWGISVDSDSPWGVVDPRFGEGTIDLLIQNNNFTDVQENFIGGQQIRPIVRGNSFIWTRPIDQWNAQLVLLGNPSERHPIDALIEHNTFKNSGQAVSLFNQQEGTVLINNHFEYPIPDYYCGGSIAILTMGGSHGFHPVIPARDGLIARNTIEGGCVGIAVLGTSNWEINKNTVNNSSVGLWLEWGGFDFSSEGIIQPTVSENNLVYNNNFRSNFTGVFIGARARNNTFRANNVGDNAFGGYFLNGPENIGFITFGPASGNTIIGATLKDSRVFDISGCYYGEDGCPQFDEDGDGLFSEDPVDNLNNDGDQLFGFSLNDEDLEEIPNFITGIQAVYGPMAPPWAQPNDTDGDGLSDTIEFKLNMSGFCLDPTINDSDGDGTSDSDEFWNGTLHSCRRP